MKRRNFLQALGAYIGAAILGTAHEELVCGIGRGSPHLIDGPGLRIEVDGTFYASGEFTAGVPWWMNTSERNSETRLCIENRRVDKV